jgi:hypothetical protein
MGKDERGSDHVNFTKASMSDAHLSTFPSLIPIAHLSTLPRLLSQLAGKDERGSDRVNFTHIIDLNGPINT